MFRDNLMIIISTRSHFHLGLYQYVILWYIDMIPSMKFRLKLYVGKTDYVISTLYSSGILLLICWWKSMGSLKLIVFLSMLQPCEKGKLKFHKLNNVNIVLKELEDRGVSKWSINNNRYSFTLQTSPHEMCVYSCLIPSHFISYSSH
jgi:hypothetical protein